MVIVGREQEHLSESWPLQCGAFSIRGYRLLAGWSALRPGFGRYPLVPRRHGTDGRPVADRKGSRPPAWRGPSRCREGGPYAVASRKRRRRRLRTTVLPTRFPIAKASVVVASNEAGSRDTVSGPDRAAGACRSLSKTGRRLVVHLKLPGGLGPSAGAPFRTALPPLVDMRWRNPCRLARRRVWGWKGRFTGCLLRKTVTADRHARLSPPAAASRVGPLRQANGPAGARRPSSLRRSLPA